MLHKAKASQMYEISEASAGITPNEPIKVWHVIQIYRRQYQPVDSAILIGKSAGTEHVFMT
jgi:hypothetical protein